MDSIDQKKNNFGLKVLFCPSHFRFTDQVGSEYYSVFNTVNRLCLILKSSVVITGKTDQKNAPYRIIEAQKNKKNDWMSDFSTSSVPISIIFALRYMITGYRILRSEQFDIIHHVRPFALGSTVNILPLLPSQKNKPFVIGEFCSPYSEEDVGGQKKGGFKNLLAGLPILILRPILRKLSAMTLKRANVVLVTDEYTKSLVSRFIPVERIHIIPHCKDKNEYGFDPSKFDTDTIKVLIVGHLIPRKRVDLGIRAFAKALKINPRLKLEIAGNGSERENLESLANELHIKDNVKFLGAIPYRQMPAIYSKSHVLLHTAKAEAFGLIYIEALASGMTVISTNTIGAQNILTTDVGIIVKNDTDVGIADAISSLSIQNIKGRSSLARAYFERKFDLDSVAIPKILDIYREISPK